MTNPDDSIKRPRGFAALSPERRREIASLGGRSVRPEHRTFSLSRVLARRAGHLGGINVPAEKRSFSRNPKLAQEAGRRGGSRPKPSRRKRG